MRTPCAGERVFSRPGAGPRNHHRPRRLVKVALASSSSMKSSSSSSSSSSPSSSSPSSSSASPFSPSESVRSTTATVPPHPRRRPSLRPRRRPSRHPRQAASDPSRRPRHPRERHPRPAPTTPPALGPVPSTERQRPRSLAILLLCDRTGPRSPSRHHLRLTPVIVRRPRRQDDASVIAFPGSIARTMDIARARSGKGSPMVPAGRRDAIPSHRLGGERAQLSASTARLEGRRRWRVG